MIDGTKRKSDKYNLYVTNKTKYYIMWFNVKRVSYKSKWNSYGNEYVEKYCFKI